MPSAEEATEAVDPELSARLEKIVVDLGDSVAETRLEPGEDLWVRVRTEAWADIAVYFSDTHKCRFFDWLSAIDWKQSPYGRSMDAQVDNLIENARQAQELSTEAGSGAAGSDAAGSDEAESKFTETGADGYAGGETRFQMVARVSDPVSGFGLILKADLPELSIETWTKTYPGASWHEREAAEMFGIDIIGHEALKNLYLPTGFEGNPLRKDFPLVARMVKPWPGIVDVEPMPEVEKKPEAPATSPLGATTTNPEDGGVQ